MNYILYLLLDSNPSCHFEAHIRGEGTHLEQTCNWRSNREFYCCTFARLHSCYYSVLVSIANDGFPVQCIQLSTSWKSLLIAFFVVM
jgi:hypothetical protein